MFKVGVLRRVGHMSIKYVSKGFCEDSESSESLIKIILNK